MHFRFLRRSCGSLGRVLGILWVAAHGVLPAFGEPDRHTTPPPLPQAHAHNDYEHRRPLEEALEQGFCSVEADIHLVGDSLLVAHDRKATRPERTLQALYLDPLRTRVRTHGGRVHSGGPTVTLLIDLKTEADSTWMRLREVLASYPDMLTRFTPEAVHTNAVTVILSGNRPWNLLAAEKERFAALDGRLPDLDRVPSPDPSLVPLVSDSWRPTFRWMGKGPLPAAERATLESLVAKAHAQGRRIRFWGAPDTEAVWKAHAEAGVDVINTDHLAELAAFLRGRH